MAKIKSENLPEILQSMADYVQECMANNEDISQYFSEIANTGLFHDSEGKVEKIKKNIVITRKDY